MGFVSTVREPYVNKPKDNHVPRQNRPWPPFVFPISLISPEVAPTSLDLLGLPFAYSQTGFLNPNQFGREAKKRGFELDIRQLELLHRRRVLVPFYRIYSRPVTDPVTRDADRPHAGDKWVLNEASEEGRLRDPEHHPFRPWPSSRTPAGVLYSTYQLLALRQMRSVISQIVVRRSNGKVRPKLSPVARRVVRSASATRALAVVLEALSPRYMPRVRRITRSPSDEMYALVDAPPGPERKLLSAIDPALILRQAEHLIGHANTFDPMGRWYRVVRIGAARRWSDLRYDALIALELRAAAEQLLLYHDDLAQLGLATPAPQLSTRFHQPRHDRLKTDFRERAETLLDFRLENSPAVVLAVEGDTEAALMPRVLEMLGVEPGDGLVDVLNLKSVDGDVRLVARSVAVPKLDPQGHVGARVLRPLTALFVAIDPEKRYSTAAGIETQRQGIISEILKALPATVRTETLRKELEHLVHIRTWGTGSFEFAHFTDHQLALAIRRIVSTAPDVRTLKKHLAHQRAHGMDIKNVWKTWPYQPSKVQLAEELWPTLRRRLLSRHIAPQLPIARVADATVRLAVRVRPVRELRTD